jgi:DNA-binding CsgD family transcriptional regulator
MCENRGVYYDHATGPEGRSRHRKESETMDSTMLLEDNLAGFGTRRKGGAVDKLPLPRDARSSPVPQPGVVLYGESDLVLTDGQPRSGGSPKLVSELIAAGSAFERERLVRDRLQAIGFDWLAYGTVVYLGGEVIPRSFLTTYSHPAWTGKYFSERYYEVDQRHHEAPCPGLPMVWDMQDLQIAPLRRSSPGRVARFERDFADSGIRCGVFFSLVSPRHQNERIVISLMSGAADRRWIADSVVGQAMTLGLCLHEFQSRYTTMSPTAKGRQNRLSAMQQEILDCLIRGLSDKEIAYRLNLSSYNVDYHLRQLRRRFAARNRVQLVSAALAASLGGDGH